MNADRWCVGFQRPPHVPNGGALIVVNDGRGARLCAGCWHAWVRTDTDEQDSR